MNMKKETKKSGSWGGLCFWILLYFILAVYNFDNNYNIAFRHTMLFCSVTWMLHTSFYFYDIVKQRNVTKKNLCFFLSTNGSLILLSYFILEEEFIFLMVLPFVVLLIILVFIIRDLFK